MTTVAGFSIFMIVFTLLLGASSFYLPTIIAVTRRHRAGAVFMLNTFAGWSVIGWVVALVWALGEKK